MICLILWLFLLFDDDKVDFVVVVGSVHVVVAFLWLLLLIIASAVSRPRAGVA